MTAALPPPPLADPISRRAKLGTGLTYHWLEWGDKDAPVVLLIHGFLDFAWTWEATVHTGLLSRYRVVAPDLRGYGDTDHIGAGGYYHFMDYVADIDALVDAVQPATGKLSIVGHSMGGSVASYFTGSFPDRVEKLVMLEGLGPPDQQLDSMAERIRAWLAAWKRVRKATSRPMRDLNEAAERLRRHDPRLDPTLALRLAERGTVELEGGQRVFKHDPLHLTPGPYPFTFEIGKAFWSRITCPVLLVGAQNSEFQYAEEDLARRVGCFADARIVMMNDCGHMMQRHQPLALAALLADFLG